MQLHFTSLVVISLRRESNRQECAHAGRTEKKARWLKRAKFYFLGGE
jgi:hypothetical protein